MQTPAAHGVSLSPGQTESNDDRVLERNLTELFAERARATPDAIAIVGNEGNATYAALAARMEAISHFLRQRSIAPEQAIGVLMRRSVDLVAVLLGILRAGGAYVPIDPDDPAPRNRRILEISGCKLVLGDRSSIDAVRTSILRTQEHAVEFVEVISIPPIDTAGPIPPSAPGGSQLAYVLFTSGSTGEPKGVEIEHRSVLNLLLAARDFLGFTAADRYLAASTIGFDISVAELFLPLITGGSLLLRDRSIFLQPRQLAEDVCRFGITVLQTGPSVWSVLLSEVPDFPKVRVAITTGEAITPELGRRLVACGDQVWNLYGPTEATVWATACRLTDGGGGGTPSTSISASIGHPIAGTFVQILDETGAPVRSGERGELCIGGVPLARGYRGNKRLTQERFNSAGPTGQRIYHTGDVVSRASSGELLYFGRNDDQLKIHGVRIEPREVESAILLHPDVEHAAATWFTNALGSRSLVVAVVTKSEVVLTAPALHQWLKSRLPTAMIPSRFHFCEKLPMSPSGKVDRNAIREKVVETPSETRQNGEPAFFTPTEARLASIWKRTLGLSAVGPEDHFFSNGGDSLAAVKMMLEVEAVFHVSIAVGVVYEVPTLKGLAARIDRARVQPEERTSLQFIYPLVEAANGIPVFFSSVDMKLAAHNAWRIPCPLFSISHWAHRSGFVQTDTVEDLARIHIAGIRTIQPAGPYRIAGFSFGGLVALEMARQLRASGDEVEFLFLLDPMQPWRTEKNPSGYSGPGLNPRDHESWPHRFARHFRSLMNHPRQFGPYVAEKFLWHHRNNPLRLWLVYKIMHLHGRRPNPISEKIVAKNRWPALWYSARRLAVKYVAKSYDGRVLAVFPERAERCEVWSELLGPSADIRFINVDHMALFAEPALSQWMNPLASMANGAGLERMAGSDRPANDTA